ncbi:MAG: 30S ribosomal protein S11 [Candidatus Taylorbacteria bacterium]|nr:30S ribosomal protein S11 [Candidatus Taylorbacteria bacterium]
MGKKRIVKTAETKPEGEKAPAAAVLSKKKVETGVLHVRSTFNNTALLLTDLKGNTLAWSSSGSLGFKGAKKGTPFAAAKVGEALALKAANMGVKEVSVVVRGVGSGRESSIRGFISKGIALTGVKDATPVPHNGPRPPKPRRV